MDVERSWVMAAIRRLSYNSLVLIPACFPALGCRKEPEPPPEVKSEAVKPEETPIDSFIDTEDLQEVDPPQSNDSPQETGTSAGEPTKEK